jgi:hypothetical protein
MYVQGLLPSEQIPSPQCKLGPRLHIRLVYKNKNKNWSDEYSYAYKFLSQNLFARVYKYSKYMKKNVNIINHLYYRRSMS